MRVYFMTSLIVLSLLSTSLPAQEPVPGDAATRAGPRESRTSEGSRADEREQQWHYGGFIDLGYLLDFNFPENHLFRNRSTTPRVNEFNLNMGGVYVKKDASERSRLGMELLVQGGQDAKEFGFDVKLPRVEGSDALRHFGRANMSYLAPIGNGLAVQAGLFNSFVGYESLYAKDNFTYTRSWIADYSPYLMFGANAVYPFNKKLTGAVFVINEYFHLQNTNSLPSYGAQLTYKPSTPWTMRQTVYYGPDQADTSLEFWRLFSDSILEWKSDHIVIALDYQIGTQRSASTPGDPRFFWTGGNMTIHWHIGGPWSVTLRPEFFWDRNGLMTGGEQLIRAVTTSTEYKLPYKWTSTILRLEYRYDESTGPGGGFFKNGQIAPGVIGLTPAQHMLIFGAIWTFDSL